MTGREKKAGRLARIADNLWRAATYDLLGLAPRSPLMVFVELTRRCNLKCRHCDIWKTAHTPTSATGIPPSPTGDQGGTTAGSADLSGHEVSADRLLEVLTGLAGRGLVAVDLFGGEPLLRQDLPRIVAGCKAAGLHVTVTTNGVLLNRRRSAELVTAGLDQLLVSLDGPSAEVHDDIRGMEGAFARATAGIATFRELAGDRVRVGLNTLVCRPSLSTLPNMVDLVADAGGTQLRLLPYHQCYPFNVYGQDDSLLPRADDVPALARALAELQDRARARGVVTNSRSYLDGIVGWYSGDRTKVRCMAGLGVCDINAFGDLYPCYTLGKHAGNVKELPFSKLWRSPEMKELRATGRNCDRCWQSCYIEPGLRLSLKAAWKDRTTLLHDVAEYFLG